MSTSYFMLVFLIGFAAVINIGSAIKCYRCNEQNNEACNKGSNSLEVHYCPNRVDKCEAYGYEIVEDGKVVSSGFQRGCLSEMGSCRLIYNSMKTLIYSATGGRSVFREKSCNVCETDLCNTNH